MKGDAMTEDDLDDLFAAARSEALPVPAGLMARVISDAEAERWRGDLLNSPQPRVRHQASGLLARLAGLFGGAGALAGMLTATVAGFWLGFAQPVPMSAVLTGVSAEIDMMPGIDALLDEAP